MMEKIINPRFKVGLIAVLQSFVLLQHAIE